MRTFGFALIAWMVLSFPLAGTAWADNADQMQTSSPENSDPDDFYSPPLGGEGCTVPDLIS